MQCVNSIKIWMVILITALTGSAIAHSSPVHAQTGDAVRLAQAEIPLPRRKPPTPAERSRFGNLPIGPQSDYQGGAQFDTNRRGRLDVSVPKIGRERDPDAASELKATRNSRWTKAEVAAAKQRCAIVLAATNIDADPLKPIGGSKGCGIAAPLRVRALGAVEVKPPARLNCTLAAALYKWVVDDVQPAARKNFKQPVVSLKNISAYSCRSRRGVAGGRISEHSFGNALDIASFTLASGEEVDLLKHWFSPKISFFRDDPRRKFLTKIHKESCKHFATSIGPVYNKAHANHFHIDLGRAGINKLCK